LGVASNIKALTEEQESNKKAKKKLAQNFNKGAMRLMEGFLKKVDDGTFTVDTVRDYKDLYNMFLDINEISVNSEESSGKIPALTVNQELSLEKHVKVHRKNTTDIQGNIHEEKVINVEDIDSLTKDDVNSLLKDRGESINQDNLDDYNE
jgi:hypothetical protein